MTGNKNWAVFYSNQGKRERTAPMRRMTHEEAMKCADFLKFQGAKKVSIRQVGYRPHEEDE